MKLAGTIILPGSFQLFGASLKVRSVYVKIKKKMVRMSISSLLRAQIPSFDYWRTPIFLRSRPIKHRLGGIISLFLKSLTHKLFSYITCTLNNNLQRFLCVSFIYTFFRYFIYQPVIYRRHAKSIINNVLKGEKRRAPWLRVLLILFRYTAEK